ncbi:unnamed protein product [Bemisia tabaci]|uniref:Lipid storage droplets surface-binding protein 1 n=1 Tax=Bemisia tabaci TaxID=7038 RepID=A0A9P0F3K1_BEMTA|nr:unnamed protein product [Bemisia tabaci]
MTVIAEKRDELPFLKSVERVASYPVVESGYNCANFYYSKVKNLNGIIGWTLDSAENSVAAAVELAKPIVSKFEHPLTVVDSFVLKNLDTVEQNIPIVKYPPEQVYHKTRSYVCNNVVRPVVKRADSVKQVSVHSAVKYSNFAAEKIDSVLDVADMYVDKYLPDADDAATSTDSNPMMENASKPQKALSHVNVFSRKLQRRLTRRTIAEAKALKHQSAETLQALIYLTKLLARDPKAFMEKARALWEYLSKNEPENQVPPQNIEQLIILITREIARKFVHTTNFSRQQLALIPQTISNSVYTLSRQINDLCSTLIKMIHLDGPVDVVMALARDQLHSTRLILESIHASVHQILERLISRGRQLAVEAQEAVQNSNSIEMNNITNDSSPKEAQTTGNDSTEPTPVNDNTEETYAEEAKEQVPSQSGSAGKSSKGSGKS